MPMTPEQIAQIQRYYHVEKWRTGTIARQLQIHHGSVERVLRQAGLPRIGVVRSSRIDPYLPFIHETLKKFPTLGASRLYTMARERGYTGGPDHFRHLIALHRPRPAAEAYLRLVTLVEEQGQIDWGHFGHLQIGQANLRKRLRLSCTAILSGHEHLGNSGKIEEQLSGSSLFFEAPALQPPELNSDAGFSIHMFDLELKQATSHTYVMKAEGIFAQGEPISHSWDDANLIHGALAVTSEFAALLNDAGGNFSHSSKERITLEDVFVCPV